MRHRSLIAVLPTLTAIGLSACGGSTSSSSSTSAAVASAPATPASSAVGAYGAPTATPAARPATATTLVALITTKRQGKLGTVLAYGPKRLTVYLFEADHGGRSACTGACAQAWPPVLGRPRASGAAARRDLGTIRRGDGRAQVTYKGHPLYRFIKDKDAGDAYGQGLDGFGALWYALAPSGNRVITIAPHAPSSSAPRSHSAPASSGPRAVPSTRRTKPTTGSDSTTPAASGGRSSSQVSSVSIAAAPSGQLAFNRRSLIVQAGTVVIRFTNAAPEPHNLTIVRGANGPMIAATPTFKGGTRALTLHLTKGSYMFFCSVPGHRMAGMQGTLTVQ